MWLLPVLSHNHDDGHQAKAAGVDPSAPALLLSLARLVMLPLLTWLAALLQEIMNVEQIMEENKGMDLTEENVESVLDEIRPYLVGAHTDLVASAVQQCCRMLTLTSSCLSRCWWRGLAAHRHLWAHSGGQDHWRSIVCDDCAGGREPEAAGKVPVDSSCEAGVSRSVYAVYHM